jgi:hypothetical protein
VEGFDHYQQKVHQAFLGFETWCREQAMATHQFERFNNLRLTDLEQNLKEYSRYAASNN